MRVLETVPHTKRPLRISEERVWADMSPQGKARIVGEMMDALGGGVAMVCLFPCREKYCLDDLCFVNR